MDADILKKESQHLDEVMSKVVSARDREEKRLNFIGEENLSMLRDLKESAETGSDFEMLIQRLSEKNEINLLDKINRLRELEFLAREPYFARIDLKDSDAQDSLKYYIGKFGYSEKNPVIIDWRAKIASVYYRFRYPQKNVYYETAGGKETKDLTLKRTFEIEDGKLFKYFNNDIQLDESEIVVDKIKKRTGGVLEDIIETIQLSQLDIIEADPRQVCIVQGCVGSGKSTVAIHKLAHIFFNYPKLIHPQKAILIAKNQILSGYLSTLFPKLGIFDINYKTLRELVYNIVFREELGLKVDFNTDKDTSDFDVKQFSKINIKINKIHDSTDKKINDIFASSEFITFKSLKYSKLNTPYENLTEIISDLEEELSGEKEYLKENPNSQRSALYKENLRALRRLIGKLTDLRADLRSKILKDMASEFGIKTGYNLGYKQTLLYLNLYSELIGITKFQKFEYCVVDEGQDFSILEFLVLSKLVLRGRFAIFGDLNQSLVSDGISKWEDISQVIKEAPKTTTFELDTNYRSTKEIIDLARQILSPYTSKFLPKSIKRQGELPELKVVNSNNELLDCFKNELATDTRDLNKSIGVINFDETIENKVLEISKEVCPKEIEVTELKENIKIRYTPNGVYLMNVNNCKGLEFSKVYVLGLNLKKIKSAEVARQAFVAVTRAMNEITIIGVK